jgi:hypothetical protein
MLGVRVGPLGNVLLDKSRHVRRLQCGVFKHPPIHLLPHSPHGIDDRTARLSLLFLWELGDRLIPPDIQIRIISKLLLLHPFPITMCIGFSKNQTLYRPNNY